MHVCEAGGGGGGGPKGSVDVTPPVCKTRGIFMYVMASSDITIAIQRVPAGAAEEEDSPGNATVIARLFRGEIPAFLWYRRYYREPI